MPNRHNRDKGIIDLGGGGDYRDTQLVALCGVRWMDVAIGSTVR